MVDDGAELEGGTAFPVLGSLSAGLVHMLGAEPKLHPPALVRCVCLRGRTAGELRNCIYSNNVKI